MERKPGESFEAYKQRRRQADAERDWKCRRGFIRHDSTKNGNYRKKPSR